MKPINKGYLLAGCIFVLLMLLLHITQASFATSVGITVSGNRGVVEFTTTASFDTDPETGQTGGLMYCSWGGYKSSNTSTGVVTVKIDTTGTPEGASITFTAWAQSACNNAYAENTFILTPDNTPEISVSGGTLRGICNISADYSFPSSGKSGQIDLYIDSAYAGTSGTIPLDYSQETIGSATIQVNATQFPDGDHTLEAYAYLPGYAGGAGVAAANITTNNAPELYMSTSGKVSGTIDVIVEYDFPSTGAGTGSIQLMLGDSICIGNSGYIPLSYTSPTEGQVTFIFDTTKFPDGSYNLKAIGWQNALYPNLGSYEVEITIQQNQPPVASPFDYFPEKPMVGGNIVFSASSSYDPDGKIVSYEWNFGDGNTAMAAVPEYPHVYEIPGKYTVTLSVTDDDGETASVSMEMDLTLEIGDLLICRSDKSFVPADEYTHIGIYIGGNMVVEARKAGGVGIYPISDWSWSNLPNNMTYVAILRVETDNHIKEKAVEFAIAKSMLGQQYDLASLLLNKKQSEGNMWYCSELIWAAYLYASDGQINLDEIAHSIWDEVVTPDEIAASNWVKTVGEHKEEKPVIFWDLNRVWGGIAYSPVNLIVTGPNGLVLSKQVDEIPGATYEEADVDEDGNLDDLFVIPKPELGDYLIQVVPEDALPEETYSLEVVAYYGEPIVLAQNKPVSDIPQQAYSVRLTEGCLELVILAAIDIKPGSYPNSINLGSQGVIPVAIISSEDFDATQVDPGTVLLSGAGVAIKGKGNALAHQEDVNGDGLIDLVVQVETENFDPNQFQDGKAILTGQTYDGQAIEGSDKISIVPPEAAPAKPTEFALHQNFSNPCNPDTWIPYQLAEDVSVAIRIYDVAGRLIRALELEH